MNVELTPDGQHYKVGKLQMPRVTSILRTLQLVRYPDDPAAMALGTASHLAIRYLLEQRLEWKSLDEQVRPRVEAARKFCKQLDVQPIDIERTVASNLGYAGTPDLICTFGRTPQRAVIDWKCGKPQHAAALQLVAYAGASATAPMGRMTVELKDDGDYSLIVWPAADWYTDWRAWLGALSLFSWVQKRKQAYKAKGE